jgi:hypothetical protein
MLYLTTQFRRAPHVVALSALIVITIVMKPVVAHAEGHPGGGGISPNKLWVNARLGQPSGGGAKGLGPLKIFAV